MNLSEWWAHLEREPEFREIALAEKSVRFLISEVTSSVSAEGQQVAQSTQEALRRVFFRRAMTGQLFGSLDRVIAHFGRPLEQVYGLDGGPFINLSKTHWSFVAEGNDLFPRYERFPLAAIIGQFGWDFGKIFCPDPGPDKLPREIRKSKLIEILGAYAPAMDIPRCIRENPSLRLRLNKDADPEEIKEYSHIRPASVLTVRCFEAFPGKSRVTCSLEKFHSGPHVAHGLFKKVYAVWED